MTKNCLTAYLRNWNSHDCGFRYTSVKRCYLQQFFSVSQKSDFLGISKFIHKCQKEIMTCTPTFLTCVWLFCSTMTYFVPIKVKKDRITKMYPNCTTMKNCDHTICSVLSIVFYMTQLIWLGFVKNLSLSWKLL